MKKIIFMLLAIVALTGCSKFEQVPTDENVPVELYGEIYGATRGAGVINGIPDPGGLLFDLYRANQDATSAYSTYTLKVNGTLAVGGAITTDPKLFYLSGNRNSSFIGLYPRADANTTINYADKTVTYKLEDGGTDILATQSLEDSKDTDPHPATALSFQHLLTKIRVDVKVDWVGATDAKREALITNIGKITAIKVGGKSVDAVVTLPTLPGGANGVRPTVAKGTVHGDLPLVKEDGTPIDADLKVDGTATTFGTAIFVPSEAAEFLTFKITTAYSAPDEYVATASAPLLEREYVAGTGYKVTIRLDESGFEVTEVGFLGNGTVGIWTENTDEYEVVYN
jgi:hypothetical protein